jgi:hypothetical protein
MTEARHRGVLLPHVEIAFDDPGIGTVDVAEVLREPDRFVGETLADPLEGVAYGRGKAKVMRRENGSLWIHSFAHGRAAYELKLDAAMVEAALRGTEQDAVVDAYVRLLPEAELEPDEEARLSELVRELSGSKARPLAVRVRAARVRRAGEEEAERRRAAAEARAGEGARPWSPHPPPGAAAGRRAHAGAAGPGRGVGGGARSRAAGAQRRRSRGRDPRPPALGPARADRRRGRRGASTKGPPAPARGAADHRARPGRPRAAGGTPRRAYPDGGQRRERAVSLADPFLRAYLGWRGSRLPLVRAVVTAPLVTRDGGLLAGAGLDRAREVVFRIEPELLALVPTDPGAITDAEVVEALRFLVDEWLFDVAAGFAGRVVLLAYALTVIERVLLPERPAFFVTAGQRGGGKTTVLTMVVAAVLGRRPPAAAWSPSAEERRKALLAYLSEGVATLVWDNIERGTAIACPSIEKALTAAEFTDRVLSVSRSATVPSTTVLAFTGNNIAPKGDMASRSLVCRLEVERPDPENRRLPPPGPGGLDAGQPRPDPARALHPASVEPAGPGARGRAGRLQNAFQGVVGPRRRAARNRLDAGGGRRPQAAGQGAGEPFRCALEPVDFGALFAAGEVEEEETAGMRELVLLLREAFGNRLFSAADLAALLQAPAVATAAAPHHGGPRHDFEQRAVEAAERAQALRGALEGTTARRCRRGRRPRRAWSASACRWWWGGRWRSVAAVARSGRWPRRTPATRPTPTGRRSCQRVAHERFRTRRPRGPARRIDPDFPGIPARRRERRESRECDGDRAARSGGFARERRRLRPGGPATAVADPRRRGMPASGCLQPPPVRSVITR